MDPYDEERLRDEVIHLHSLWHQGPPPPRQNPDSLPFGSPYSVSVPYLPQPPAPYFPSSPWLHQYNFNNPRPTYPRALQPINSATFKKKNKKKKKKRPTQSDPHSDSGSEWPCPTPADESVKSVSGWPTAWKPHSTTSTKSVSAQEPERLAALQAQYRAFQACREFLFKGDSFDDDEGNHIEDDDDSEEEEDVGDSGSEEFGDFVLKIFTDDSELRNHYEKCYESGEFCCFVCGAIGKKNCGKKFRDCVGLVQHSMAISKTLKKRAHRAFGQAVCQVLGWDINRLPTIVTKGQSLGCPVQMKPAESVAEPKKNANDAKDGSESSDESDNKAMPVEYSRDSVEQVARGFNQTVDQNLVKEDDLNNNTKNHDEKILDIRSDKAGTKDEVSHKPLVSGAEWICNTPKDDSSSTSQWPAFNTWLSSQTSSLSAEEQARLEVQHLQHKALETCQEFLAGNVGLDSDEDDNNDEVELMDDYDSEDCEEFKFFRRVFTEDSDLRMYYENYHREGDFYCLVCGGIGKKLWKRFKDCIALLQHSTAIVRIKRKRAHRAYAKVICKVLGWDIDRLPAIVLKDEPLASSLVGLGKGEPKKPVDACIDDSNVEPEKPADGHIDDS